MSEISALLSDIERLTPGLPIKREEPMREHTSFRIGGPVDAMLLPRSAEELEKVSRAVRASGVRHLLLGNGSNLLVSDAPLDMLVIKTCDGLCSMTQEDGETVSAESGALLSRIASFALACGLTGFEFAHGIPGTLGGAVFMNAGAYGGEMKDVVTSTDALCGLEHRIFCGTENEFSYRHSRYSDTDDVVLSARLKLKPGDPTEIRVRMEELSAKRRASQPLSMPSAGSTFKRPVTGYAAAMIQEAGLKGYTVGGAQVSEKHAGFVVNTGGASFEDVLRVMEHVTDTVYRKFGVMLSPEVRIIR